MNKHVATAILIVVVILCSCTNSPSTETIDSSTVIAKIDKARLTIDTRIDSLESIRIDVFGRSSEGGGWVGYFNGRILEKITTTYCGELGQVLLNYYFEAGDLLTVVQMEQYYDRPLHEEGMRIRDTLQSRYYFANGNLIRWIGADGKDVDSSRETYSKKARELIAEATECKAELVKRRQEVQGADSRIVNERQAREIAKKYVCDPTRARTLEYDPARLPEPETMFWPNPETGNAYKIAYSDTAQNIWLIITVYVTDGRVVFLHGHHK